MIRIADAPFLAVDWGTSNRRGWRIEPHGSAVEVFSDAHGILNINNFPASVAALRREHAGLPVLMAGMIGSNRGWVEVPYVPAPAGLQGIASAVLWVEADVGIVPGVAYDEAPRADVMRGEEVQLLGALALGWVTDGLACHPGTHTKWVELDLGEIARFRTVMTGDMFAALAAKSILSDLLKHPAPVDASFIEGVDHGLEHGDLTAALFTARARVLLGQAEAVHAASYVSGLLIGADVRAGLGRLRADVVPVIGAPELTARFAAALVRAGRQPVEYSGETAFVAGMRAIAGVLR